MATLKALFFLALFLMMPLGQCSFQVNRPPKAPRAPSRPIPRRSPPPSPSQPILPPAAPTTPPAPMARAPPPPSSDQIDHFILAVMWPETYCQNKPECQPPRQHSLPNFFTIHGLWPQKAPAIGAKPSETSSYIFCDDENHFDIRNIVSIRAQLEKYWPTVIKYKQIGEDFAFWGNEWRKHGTCCVPMFNQTEYFKTTLELYRELDVMAKLRNGGIKAGVPLTVSQIRNALSGREPFMHCGGTNPSHLEQLYFCIDRTAQQYIDCRLKYHVDSDCTPSFFWSK